MISTALIPGKPAPTLLTEEMVREMKPGSVIVDLAAEAVGNCTLTEPGEDILRHEVTILGPLNLPATVPLHASQMYSRNLTALLGHLVKDGLGAYAGMCGLCGLVEVDRNVDDCCRHCRDDVDQLERDAGLGQPEETQ